MSTKVWLSTHGRPLDPEAATISVFDRGFLYGDSVYETMRTVAGTVIVEVDAHLQRLRRSADGIAFELPFTDVELVDAMTRTLAAAGNRESRIRLVITRGTGPINLDTRVAGTPVVVVVVEPLPEYPPEAYEAGVSAVIVDRSGVMPGLKTGNYLGNILALRRAHQLEADDAIMCNAAGEVTEGATSNVFVVRDGRVATPCLTTGLLAGITRDTVLRLFHELLGEPVDERTLMPDDLRQADELMLTSSVRGVMPVTTLDGEPVGDGRAGPSSRKLLAAYAEYLRAMAPTG